MAPEADEEERRQAGQLPEHQHQQQVLGQHHPEHGAHEQQQEGEEAPHGLFFRQVVAGVEDDQQADAEDQQGEEETQAIEAQAETQAEPRQPGQDELQRVAGEDAIGLEQQQDQAAKRHQGGDARAEGTTMALGQRWKKSPEKGQRDNQRQYHP
ncbi:hypothetical protein D3C72_1871880 [compost metagenome]